MRPGIPTTFQPEMTLLTVAPFHALLPHLHLPFHDPAWTWTYPPPPPLPVPPLVSPPCLPPFLPARSPTRPPHTILLLHAPRHYRHPFVSTFSAPHLPPIHYLVNSIHISSFASSCYLVDAVHSLLIRVPPFSFRPFLPRLSTYCDVL